MLEIFRPEEYYPSIFEIDLGGLKKKGIKGLIVDLDNTLLPRYEEKVPLRLLSWLKELNSQGFKAVIVSNNWSGRVTAIAAKLNLPLVAPAVKPRRGAFKRGMKVLGTAVSETAVIGDQLFTDVFGGKRCGLYTILVKPASPKEMFHTRVLRYFEKIILRRLQKPEN